MYQNPLDKQKQVIVQERLDALISFSPENVAYSAGFTIPSQAIGLRKRVFACVVTPEREAMLVAPVELNQCRNSSRIQDIRTYNEFNDDPMAVLTEMVKQLGVARGRIGVEIDFLPGRHWVNLQRHLPQVTWVDAESIFDRMRSIKTQEEIDALRKVGRIVHEAHVDLARNAKPGWTEMQMALRLTEYILTHGADGVHLLVVGSGERSVYPNGFPTERVIRNGDVIRVDVFAHTNRYLSDIARTLVVGKANPEQKDIWRKLCEVQTLLIEQIRPGASTRAIWEKFLDRFERLGLNPAINFVGHGLGLTLHEEPSINRFSDHILEEGMVLAIEPLHFVSEWGFHIEDEVIVTRDGCELISDGRGELPELG